MFHTISHRLRQGGAILMLFVLAACSTVDRSPAPNLLKGASWAILPFANHTDTPLAGSRAEAIALTALQAQGVNSVRSYPGDLQQQALFDVGSGKAQDEAQAWAKSQGIRYALAGAVDEWRYKVGVDGEPVVGFTLQIIDLESGTTLWRGGAGKSGWSREALSSLARQLMRDLLQSALSGRA